jgi:hypothetical protein
LAATDVRSGAGLSRGSVSIIIWLWIGSFCSILQRFLSGGTELSDATQALVPASDCNYAAPALPTVWSRIRQLGGSDQGFMVVEKLADELRFHLKAAKSIA